ncbi:MAG TPA: SRPBCC family protein [Candidatus Limnocylindrales bacterium]
MTTLREQIATTLPPGAVFDYVADFQSAAEWDPGVAHARRLDAGPLGVGSRYELGVRMGGRVVPMTYRITVFERPSRVVLEGEGSNVAAIDDIRFVPAIEGTVVDYTADIRLRGWMRLIQPFVGGALAKVGRDAAAGMTRTLAARAAAAERDRTAPVAGVAG